ncbi:TetR/AcrR family transcriptional regulator [Frankia sp. AgB32]|uniref:TetR/AcrR family transcriptional regulator n=1 Tax=Frankia sp. AgB32 TaxID=631119 RepID=UPI00200F5844|nr:TetR/AcrR family transcriptional regulator [Frankia sp. AgB32]MCK9898191.1 TetR/AcrR family transcriptional regulator [Frankia sp. AgB32]
MSTEVTPPHADPGSAATSEQRRRRGRPRGLTPRVRRDVYTAVRTILGTVGYEALRIDDVAAAAGVHKTTLYRQWSSKADLVRDVLVAAQAAALPRPDAGSWDEDLALLCEGLLAVFNHPSTLALVKTRVTANDELLTAGLNNRADDETTFLGAPFDRAVARGEIDPATDVPMMVEVLMSALITRLCVTRLPIDRDFLDRLARMIRAAAGTGPNAARPAGGHDSSRH